MTIQKIMAVKLIFYKKIYNYLNDGKLRQGLILIIHEGNFQINNKLICPNFCLSLVMQYSFLI